MSFLGKLFKSTQSAVPLVPGCLAALAHGFRFEVPPAEFPARLAELQSRGIVAGLWAELNPQLAEAAEALLAAPPADSIARWRSPGAASALFLGAEPPAGSRRDLQWFKAGLPLGGLRAEPAHLLAPDSERSFRCDPAATPRLRFREEWEAELVMALARPRPLAADRDPWEELGAELDIPAAEVLAALKRLTVEGVLRRVALRWSPAGLGWRGCGLAEWDFEDAAGAAPAGDALAGLLGTGDVAWREGPGGSPRLTALFLAPGEGVGRAAAESVAAQWSRPLAAWTTLPELR
ncbi:MAG: Lrp/AsnC family transcriptional regulator [Candidatus Sumerlaeia bacterium]|nr:Lrp/AsnC family transcriptional regulator [Candidatus Sumerlaeia bacterium]